MARKTCITDNDNDNTNKHTNNTKCNMGLKTHCGFGKKSKMWGEKIKFIILRILFIAA